MIVHDHISDTIQKTLLRHSTDLVIRYLMKHNLNL